MTSPDLEDKAIRIIGEMVSNRNSVLRGRDGSAGDNDYPATRYKDSRQVLNRRVEVSPVKVTDVLLIHVTTIGEAKAPPACREDSDAAKRIDWIVVEGVWSFSSHVHRRARFADQLQVLVNREVKTESR